MTVRARALPDRSRRTVARNGRSSRIGHARQDGLSAPINASLRV